MGNISRLSAGDSYTGVFVVWIEEWSQFFEPCNWRTFHPIYFEIEDDRMMGGVEATLIVLGLGARLRWNYAKTERVAEIDRRMEAINAALKPKGKPPNE